MEKLSEAEEAAIELLREHQGEILTTAIESKNSRGAFGSIVPGIAVFKKLEKKGLVFFTIEDPIVLDDGTEFTFTNSIRLVTDSNDVT